MDKNGVNLLASIKSSLYRGLVISFLVATLVLVLTWFDVKAISSKIAAISKGLSKGADLVDKAAGSIASASEQLSASATQQAAALQETTASVEETSAMISKNADNAKKSSEVSEASQSVANKGKEVVQEMIFSVGEIAKSNTDIMHQIEESNREISEIVKVITEIGNKTKVINDIVFQTKLLSFNASVEAARAGDHGKGFAVVAEEVGNLAQMSGNAAKEISEMLDGSIEKVEQIVANTKIKVERLVKSGKEKVQSGTLTAQRCEEVLDEIVTNVIQVSSMVGEITVASHEQARGVEGINKAMNQLDQVAQQNNSAFQQAASSATELQGQVTELRGMVDQLNQTVHGSGSSRMAEEDSLLFERKKEFAAEKSRKQKKAVAA